MEKFLTISALNMTKKHTDFHKNYLGIKNANKHSKQGQRKHFLTRNIILYIRCTQNRRKNENYKTFTHAISLSNGINV